MQRGEVRLYSNMVSRARGPVARLVVAAQSVLDNPEVPTVTTLLVYADARAGLLSVPVGDIGYASALAPEASLRSLVGEVLHTCSPDELEQIDVAIRAALDV